MALEGRQVVGTAVCTVATRADKKGINSPGDESKDDEEEEEFPVKFGQLEQFFTDLGTDHGRLNVYEKVS